MDHRLPFLGGPLPPGFRRWTVTLAPGETLPYAEDDWCDALVTVTEGRIEVECLAGGHAAFAAGAMVWMVGLELRAIHNRAEGDAVLVAVARAPTPRVRRAAARGSPRP